MIDNREKRNSEIDKIISEGKRFFSEGKKLFSEGKKIVSEFINPKFYTLADSIVEQIKSVEGIRKAKVIVNFNPTKVGNIKISLDLVGRVAEGPYINEGFLETAFGEEEIPQYLSMAINSNELQRVSLSEDDLEDLYAHLQLKSELMDTIEWSELVESCKKTSTCYIELFDKMFFTTIRLLDENKALIKTFKIGILNDAPKEIFEKLYPFKDVLVKM